MIEPSAERPSRAVPWTGRDLAVVAVLVATAFVIGAPILEGGWLTYFDNPPHIAEIRALAGEGASGWSEIGFAGISLDSLHSPVFWRGLALLDRGGVDIGPVYAVLVCLALAAPAVAVYAVARRRMPLAWAAVLAYVVLVQRTAIIGTASATGGMWTFYLATAALILLADRLARPTSKPRDTAAIAALLGFIGLTHLFVLEAAVILVVVHAVWTLVTRRTRPGTPRARAIIARDAMAGVIGAAAAIAYWFPVIVSGGGAFQPPQNHGMTELAQLLFMPSDRIMIVAGLPSAATLPFYLEMLPQVSLVIAGVVGAAMVRRRDFDPVPAYGVGLAAVVIALLAICKVWDLSLLGPVSWRFVYFLRIGCALAAIPLLAWLGARVRARPVTMPPMPAAGRFAIGTAAAAAAIACGLVWGAGVRRDVVDTDGPELADVRALWAWLRAERRPDWGRIYVQDTFMAPPYADGLTRSHVLALTLDQTGLAPIGPYYGVVPASTARYTLGEFGMVFASPSVFRRVDDRVVIDVPLGGFGATHLVTATRRSAQELERAGWQTVHRVGRFTVFRHRTTQQSPVGIRDGRFLIFELTGDAVVAHSYHPFWRVAVGPPTARVELGSRGRMAIAGLPPGAHTVALEYRPPRVWPVSAAGWVGILVLALIRRRRWRGTQG